MKSLYVLSVTVLLPLLLIASSHQLSCETGPGQMQSADSQVKFISTSDGLLFGCAKGVAESCQVGSMRPETKETASLKGKGNGWTKVGEFSKELDIAPGRDYYLYFDNVTCSLGGMQVPDETLTLTQKETEAVNRTPLWLKPDLIRTFQKTGVDGDIWADLILNEANGSYIDELAFSIAHTSYDLLLSLSNPDVYVENVHTLHAIDQYVEYADIVDRCDADGNYSTIIYRVNESGQTNQYELPRDIYYWYVVHPRVHNANPTYIEPKSGSEAAPPDGKFWRDYLFNHNDSKYPDDPPSGTVKYPKDSYPPLLREKLAGVLTLWNCTSYTAPAGYENSGHNNSRPWNYGDHAIERVSNWVEQTLPLNAEEDDDSSRPSQPVKIATEHNGNCGELQDLSTAAGRAALIPVRTVDDFCEDHVWQEFYDRGWHHWDNWWSDGGTGVNTPWIYKPGWGKKIQGIYVWKGNDYCGEQSTLYSKTANLTVTVLDSDNNTVDGAQVLLAVNDYDSGLWYSGVTMWNHTDGEGKCVFKIGDGPYTCYVRADSEECGSYPSDISSRVEAVQNPVANQTY